jgi:hypothetical protein
VSLERLGREHVRGLEVWLLERPARPSSATATALDQAADWIRAHRRAPEPWQRGDETAARRQTDALKLARRRRGAPARRRRPRLRPPARRAGRARRA